MKSRAHVSIASAILIGLAISSAEPMYAQSQQTVSGYLYSKLSGVGTRSEGPVYFLQKFDGSEIQIAKRTTIFQDDARLRAHIGTKITIVGTVTGNALSYTSVESCARSTKGCEIQWGR
jgi:hypothetical protein